MIEVRVGQRGEIVIPKRIRERYGIKPNSTLQLAEKAETVELRPQSQEDASDAYWRRIDALPKVKIDPKIMKMEPYEDEDEN